MDSLGPGGHFGFTTDKERSIKTLVCISYANDYGVRGYSTRAKLYSI